MDLGWGLLGSQITFSIYHRGWKNVRKEEKEEEKKEVRERGREGAGGGDKISEHKPKKEISQLGM